jgi:hypothetical protein
VRRKDDERRKAGTSLFGGNYYSSQDERIRKLERRESRPAEFDGRKI